MNDLIKAILEDDPTKVRELILADPSLLTVRSESGYLPLDLAHNAGKFFCELALLKLSAPCETQIDYPATLVTALGAICQSKCCANWIDDVEYLVWHGTVIF